MQIFSITQPERFDFTPQQIFPSLVGKSNPAGDRSTSIDLERYVVFMTNTELAQYKDLLEFPGYAISECLDQVVQTPKVEVLNALLYGVLNSVEEEGDELIPREINFFLTHTGIVVIGNPCDLLSRVQQSVLMEIKEKHIQSLMPARALFLLMEKLVVTDMNLIRKLDEAETNLEEKLLANEKINYLELIFRLRQKTLLMTQYAGLMADLADILEDNENGLIPDDALQMFRLMSARIDRLDRTALALREGVMQLRETYQAQVDINANHLMKVFTVISAIFLPIMTLVGWYGMNFRHMPELEWEYGYPVTIAFSAVITITIIYIFKKKRYL